ncbi:MAG: ribosome maturation factor RimM [Thermodesulfobacteriota bacterium]
MEVPEYLEYGKVLRAHGLHGELRIIPFSRDTSNLPYIDKLYIKTITKEEKREYRITGKTILPDSAIIKLEGVDTKQDAERLRGSIIYVEISQLEETEEDEYYWFQLKGLRVFDEGDRYLGSVDNLIDGSSHTLLVVKNGDKEFLVPMVETIVKDINTDAERIIIDPPEGLLD